VAFLGLMRPGLNQELNCYLSSCVLDLGCGAMHSGREYLSKRGLTLCLYNAPHVIPNPSLCSQFKSHGRLLKFHLCLFKILSRV
jgi:hypothetical protein